MSERLIRALERGGCAARKANAWGIWRSTDLRRRCIGQLSNGAIATLRESGQLVRNGKRDNIWIWNGCRSRRINIEEIDLAPDAGPIALSAVLGRIKDRALYAAVSAAVMRLNGDVTSVADTDKTLASERLAEICRQLGPMGYTTVIDLVVHKRALARFTSSNDQAPANTISRLRQVLVDLSDAYGLLPASLQSLTD